MSPLRDHLARLFLEPEPAEAPPPAEGPSRWLPPAAAAPLPPPPRPAPAPLRAVDPRPEAVAPPRPAAPPQPASPASPARIAVVCAPRDLRLAGAAAALALLHRTAARCAVVVEWGPAPPAADRPAAPAARRCAASLAGHGLAATAAGRLVRVACGTDEARFALPELAGTPAVLAVAGARDAEVEALVAEQELVLVVHRPEPEPEMAALAVAGLAAAGCRAVAVELAASPAAAALARAGHTLVAPLRDRFLEALA